MSGKLQDEADEPYELSEYDQRIIDLLSDPTTTCLVFHDARCRTKSERTEHLCNCTPRIVIKSGARA